MGHVFISYSHQDYSRAANLHTALERSRIPVWWDPKIQIGESFTPAIENALKQATAVLVLWSHSSCRSAWVIKEATIARSQGKLLPVLLDRVQPPGEFAQYDCVNLTAWNSSKPHHEFDQLRRHLLNLFHQGGGSWNVERLDQETLLVRMSREQHTVSYTGGHLYVDGELRVKGFAAVVDQRTFGFELSDGDKYYPARLDVWVTMLRGKVKRLLLEVGGSVVYDG